jgi:hypothetical protein
MKSLIRMFAAAAIAAIAIAASATPASAQNAFQGSFTLPSDVRWQGAMLPAGDYTFTMQSAGIPAKIIVRGPNHSVAFVLTAATSKRVTGQGSCLLIERRGGSGFVRELYLADSGLHLRYAVPKIPKNEQQLAQGPVTTEQVLVATNNYIHK